MNAYEIAQLITDALDSAAQVAVERIAEEIAEKFEETLDPSVVESAVDELDALKYNYDAMTRALDIVESSVYEVRSNLDDAINVTDNAINELRQ